LDYMGLGVWQPKPTTLACALAALATCGAFLLVSMMSQANSLQYQRRGAPEAACRDAAAELSLRLHSPVTFVDNCRQPKVTPLSNKPGFLIVSRVVYLQIGHNTTRRTYSALMDGRHMAAWRMIGLESAPNVLSITELAER
jgi:hypothetical protein